MPRWRRRRFKRLRKKKKDDHTWVLKKVVDRKSSRFDLPSMGSIPAVFVHLKMDFILTEKLPGPTDDPADDKFAKAKSHRQCSVCGQTSINGKPVPLSCKDAVIKKVMES